MLVLYRMVELHGDVAAIGSQTDNIAFVIQQVLTSPVHVVLGGIGISLWQNVYKLSGCRMKLQHLNSLCLRPSCLRQSQQTEG